VGLVLLNSKDVAMPIFMLALVHSDVEVVGVAITCKPTKSTTDRTWLLQFRYNRHVSGPAATEKL
jgi:hypothetical protein